jgi:hypothetical protein
VPYSSAPLTIAMVESGSFTMVYLITEVSLDYHVVDPLGDDEKDEQQSDVLEGC